MDIDGRWYPPDGREVAWARVPSLTRGRSAGTVPATGGDMTDRPSPAPLTGYCAAAYGHPFHGPYHDREYGFPIRDDDRLFERLVLEINQAGLSWLTILKKREAFRRAYDDFRVERVAAYGEEERARLLADAGIIRNRLKVGAAIENAVRVRALRETHGSFAGWLDAHHPLEPAEWTRLFRATFRFTGPEIVREFLVSTGYLQGAHPPTCPVHARVVAAGPPWMRTGGGERPDAG
jgi:DNA-3-methyladenine glycosylase I